MVIATIFLFDLMLNICDRETEMWLNATVVLSFSVCYISNKNERLSFVSSFIHETSFIVVANQRKTRRHRSCLLFSLV